MPLLSSTSLIAAGGLHLKPKDNQPCVSKCNAKQKTGMTILLAVAYKNQKTNGAEAFGGIGIPSLGVTADFPKRSLASSIRVPNWPR